MIDASSEWVVCNGIDGATGRYALAPLSIASVAERARALAHLPRTPRDTMRSGLRDWTRLGDLRRMGWGVVFPAGTPEAVKEALEPLLAHRREQAGARFKVLDYNPHEEGFCDWLQRHDVGPGDPNRDRVPFYLLLVGEPSDVPFEVQYLLDIEYAVGRLAFDTPAEYEVYARSVVSYERALSVMARREIVYWGPEHERDLATQVSARQLLRPLVRGEPELFGLAPPASAAGFRSTSFEREAAMKQPLMEALHRTASDLPPAMIFTASHGLGWPKDHPHQLSSQGALLAQDWTPFEGVSPEHYIAASDVGDNARVHGLVAFLYACFGAGTPAWDSFNEDQHDTADQIAPRPFVSALPRRLLAHPNGGALAVIGHVDRAWGFSILSKGGQRRIGPFARAIEAILNGQPVGLATHDMSARHAVLGASLMQLLSTRAAPSDRELATAWIEHTDARSYVVLGDPAARLSARVLG